MTIIKRAVCFVSILHKNLLRNMSVSNVDRDSLITDFKEWRFKSPPSYCELPISDNPVYNEPVAVNNFVFSKVPTEPLTGNLSLVCASDDAMENILDLSPSVAESEEFIKFVAGEYLPEGGYTVCHRYGGYQFGFWADQLGDGRAHLLGEYVNSRGASWQLQLKGSGETPYSRMGDGRAVLRSSLRELVGSEACAALGVPSTRAAALIVSDTHQVYRDINYSGQARRERCATVLRLAPSWYRLGSLEILLRRREPALLRTLADFIIEHDFPHIPSSAEDKYLQFYRSVALRNLDMVASWQGVGFTHGVLNTDNVSLLGLTVDFGPFGFVEGFSSHYVPNTSDDMGRYAFGRQPEVMLWNLAKFSEVVSALLPEHQRSQLRELEASLRPYVEGKILETYTRKLGLAEARAGDEGLVQDLMMMMERTSADFTQTFRQLGELDLAQLQDQSQVDDKWSLKILSADQRWTSWLQEYTRRIEQDGVSAAERAARMSRANPAYVARNWMLQDAIAAAHEGDYDKTRFLLKVLGEPYTRQEAAERQGFAAPPPSWAQGLRLSCSS